MCGRFYTDEDSNERLFNIYKKVKDNYPEIDVKHGEIFPSDIVPIANKELELIPQKWGITDQIKLGTTVINSRSESIESRIYLPLFKENRVVIPCSGYYEWNANKEKYYFSFDKPSVLFMCGISTGLSTNNSFSIITTDAHPNLKTIHSRMPLILNENEVKGYLTDYEFALYKLKHNVDNIVYSISK